MSSTLATQAAILTTITTGPVASAADWPEFRFGPTHSGLNPAETVISAGNAGSLATAWTAPAGGGVYSSPAVAGGTAYLGSDDGKLYAFDASGVTNCSAGPPRTCSPLWTAVTGGAEGHDALGRRVADGQVPALGEQGQPWTRRR